MSYADSIFYIIDYGGTTIPAEPTSLIESQLKAASRAIDSAVRYKIQDFSALTEFQQQQVKLATCAQADHTYQYGALSSMLGLMGGYSIGDVSISGKGETNESVEAAHYKICDAAVDFLMPTGLLFRGV